MHKRMKCAQEMLMACIEKQLTQLDQTDTKELGEAIDMIKDLEEAIYYETITKAMEEGSKEKEKRYYDRPEYYGDRAYYDNDRMYYDGNSGSNSSQYYQGRDSQGRFTSGRGSRRNYEDSEWGDKEYMHMRDSKEGRSPMSRKMYMETKERSGDKAAQMRELENYMQELTSDVVEMVEGASQEEKQYLSKRVASLANKLAQLND